MERLRFSCGFIDGTGGNRTVLALRAFQESRGLPVTGEADAATWKALDPGAAVPAFTTYQITQADADSLRPVPSGWIAKSQADTLGYNSLWELLGEKFHGKRAWLRTLNPGEVRAGDTVKVPNLHPAPPLPAAALVRIRLGDRTIEALDASGRIVAHFPCSIAKDKDKRPSGQLFVKVLAPRPNYTFDPKLFADAAAREGITGRLIIPPGPNNPVGAVWIGLSLPTYGIHGTPEPEDVSRTASHGCFRLANWNAEALLGMVRVGTPIEVDP
jgi:lipoprotein-anchoring transpeptidase ErfK/SrfK